MLHSITDSVCLKKLGSIDHRIEISGIPVGLLHVIHDLSVCPVIPLMLFHHIGKNIPVLRQRKCLHCLQTRKRLESKLTGIPEIILTVFGKWLISVPYLPVMHIPRSGSLGASKLPPEDGLAGQ